MWPIGKENKEMARVYSDTKREEILAQAPQARFEAELRKDIASSLFQAIVSLVEEIDLNNLIRGFIKAELNFYTDSSFRTVCRWWQAYLIPNKEPKIHRKYEVPDFEDSLYWYERQGGQAISQALYFLVSQGMAFPPQLLLGKKEHYM